MLLDQWDSLRIAIVLATIVIFAHWAWAYIYYRHSADRIQRKLSKKLAMIMLLAQSPPFDPEKMHAKFIDVALNDDATAISFILVFLDKMTLSKVLYHKRMTVDICSDLKCVEL